MPPFVSYFKRQEAHSPFCTLHVLLLLLATSCEIAIFFLRGGNWDASCEWSKERLGPIFFPRGLSEERSAVGIWDADRVWDDPHCSGQSPVRPGCPRGGIEPAWLSWRWCLSETRHGEGTFPCLVLFLSAHNAVSDNSRCPWNCLHY